MGLFSRSSASSEAREARREHNSRFNNKNTDPDSPEFLASHDRVVKAEKDAKKSRRW
ncbi:hypothetical protein [Streptomyces sp.]|uniref:hypothetical protein n=1 Tax=Streptomyces sp. TaxID=1931 RepID=UPI002F91D20B